MNKALIFDLDGVVIDSESAWDLEKSKIFSDLFGAHSPSLIGITRGLNIDAVFAHALKQTNTPRQSDQKAIFIERIRAAGDNIYQQAPLTEGVTELLQVLTKEKYAIGIVSASPKRWITMTLDRITGSQCITTAISLEERTDLPHKPAPDGYLEAIRLLGATPETTLILEDSDAGIKAAKASGAYTIALRQN